MLIRENIFTIKTNLLVSQMGLLFKTSTLNFLCIYKLNQYSATKSYHPD